MAKYRVCCAPRGERASAFGYDDIDCRSMRHECERATWVELRMARRRVDGPWPGQRMSSASTAVIWKRRRERSCVTAVSLNLLCDKHSHDLRKEVKSAHRAETDRQAAIKNASASAHLRNQASACRPVAPLDGLKSETFCRDLKILINPAAELIDATTPATVLDLSVSDVGGRPH